MTFPRQLKPPGKILDACELSLTLNVMASAIFFGGKLLKKYNGKKLNFTMVPLFSAMEIINSSSKIAVCRDPDDDKFISCAIDGKCLYIVSGDKDLLTLKEVQNVQIVTVTNFFRLLSETEE